MPIPLLWQGFAGHLRIRLEENAGRFKDPLNAWWNTLTAGKTKNTLSVKGPPSSEKVKCCSNAAKSIAEVRLAGARKWCWLLRARRPKRRERSQVMYPVQKHHRWQCLVILKNTPIRHLNLIQNLGFYRICNHLSASSDFLGNSLAHHY